MNQKTMISITLVAAFTIAIISAANRNENAEAYDVESLSAATAGAYNVAKNARISSFAMETCTNQIQMQDYSNVDACAAVIKTFDKYMSQAVSEANSDIQKITGFGAGY